MNCLLVFDNQASFQQMGFVLSDLLKAGHPLSVLIPQGPKRIIALNGIVEATNPKLIVIMDDFNFEGMVNNNSTVVLHDATIADIKNAIEKASFK